MLLVYLVLSGLVRTWACPSSCVCKWKGGKQTIDCANKSLITLPTGMDHGTQVLDFTGNNLDRLLKERFQRMGLINLQKIYLSKCRIKHIEDRAFKGLTNLIELDLSDNLIAAIPTETFYDYPALMRLILNGNTIRQIRAESFQPLSYLTNLELSQCQTELIEDNAFEGLVSLEWLKLDNNKLNFIKGHNILPRNLHGIDMHNNPWQCDCNLVYLSNWLKTFNVPHSEDLLCVAPERLKNKDIRSIETENLACPPDVKPTPLFFEISEGQNVSLICRVSAVPEAKVSWWYQGNILQNDSTIAPGLHLYYFLEDGRNEKTSELFIFNTNAEDNGTFVCIAENPAGRAHLNYTIRIILKEEPLIGLAVFPYEYFIVVSAAVSVLALLGVICITLCLVQCKRQKRRKRKKDRKIASMRNDKAPPVREGDSTITRLGSVVQAPKVNGFSQDMVAFTSGPGVLVIPSNLKYNPSLLQSFTDPNPDLINDTSKEWLTPETETVLGTLPRRDNFPKHLAADVHLSPGKFMDQDGYPVDYGLPKITGFPVMPPNSFYRTLPHKRHTSCVRFSREAEFVTKTGICSVPYDQSNISDVRYTLDGYPSPSIQNFQDLFISPPAGYKTETKTNPQWPESSVDSVKTQNNFVAQTSLPQEVIAEEEEPQGLLESPDEGYEGETVEAVETVSIKIG